MTWLGWFLFGLLFPPLDALAPCAGLLLRGRLTLRRFAAAWLGLACFIAVIWLTAGVAASGLGASLSALIALAVWLWTRRKDMKRAVRALGNKARARLAAMARSMPRPGPALRPVPQGAPS